MSISFLESFFKKTEKNYRTKEKSPWNWTKEVPRKEVWLNVSLLIKVLRLLIKNQQDSSNVKPVEMFSIYVWTATHTHHQSTNNLNLFKSKTETAVSLSSFAKNLKCLSHTEIEFCQHKNTFGWQWQCHKLHQSTFNILERDQFGWRVKED